MTSSISADADAEAEAGAGVPLASFGFDAVLHGRPKPTATELDEIFGGRPVAVWGDSGHTIAVSSVTLRELGDDRQSPDDPEGAVAVRSEPIGASVSHRPRYARGMIMFLIRALIFLVAAAAGLLVADLVFSGFTIDWRNPVGFILAIVIFAVLQSILAPWLAKVARRNAPVLLGGIGIVSTFAALAVTALIPGTGLSIGAPWATWLAAPFVVWLVTALATWLLPAVFLKKKVDSRRAAV